MRDRCDFRFFKMSDPSSKEFIFEMPETWPFRYYEYLWASDFAEANDVTLDAASGVCHPFKFYLSDHCKEVHACDIDKRIILPEEIVKEISDVFGTEVAEKFPEKYLSKIQYKMANLTQLPYESNKFDKIYCISVIEHLKLEDMLAALIEFNRTLKSDGIIVLTFDYPTVNVEYLLKAVSYAGLEFAGKIFTNMPKDAICCDIWGRLYCMRAVLRKRQM